MKTKDKLNAKVVELNEEDIEQVSGGIGIGADSNQAVKQVTGGVLSVQQIDDLALLLDGSEANLNFQNVDLR